RRTVTARIGRRLAEIHQQPAVRRPSGPFHQEIPREEALSRAVGPHYPDVERPTFDFGEGDQIAARRPDRRAVFARTETNAFDAATVRIHYVKLLGTAAIRIKGYLAAVRREAGRGVDCLAVGQPHRPARPQIQ